MECREPEERHLYNPEHYLRFLLSQYDTDMSLELCKIYPKLFPTFIKIAAFLAFKDSCSEILKDKVRKHLALACSSTFDDAGTNRLTCCSTILGLKIPFPEWEEIYQLLIRNNPVEFAGLLVHFKLPSEALQVISSAIQYNVDSMNRRAGNISKETPPDIIFIPPEQFKMVFGAITSGLEEFSHIQSKEPERQS